MQTAHGDLLAHVRARIDELVAIHIKSLVAGSAATHDRTAGKIEALTSLKKDLAQVSRDFQVYDEEESPLAPQNPRSQQQNVQRVRR